jgi:hypothetical protein
MPDFGVRWRMETRFADRIRLESGNQSDTLKQFSFMAGVDTALRGKSNANKTGINEAGT